MTDSPASSSLRFTSNKQAGAARYMPAAFIALLFIAAITLTWTGVGPGDVGEYVKAALAWRDRGPVLGETHWALRLPYVLPMAAIFKVFGAGEFTTTFTNILYAGGLVAITFIFARKHFGRRTGLIIAALVSTSAFLVLFQIDVRVFGAELFFTVLATWIFIVALLDQAGAARFFLVGLIAGLAWLCRENAVFLPASLGLVLLFRRPLPWRAIIALSAGFGAIILAELVVYGAVTGDPLYRYMVDMHHNAPTPGDAYGGSGPPPSPLERFTRPFGQLMTTPTVTPFFLLALLVLAIPRFRSSFREGAPRLAFTVFGVSSAMSFITSGSILDLTAPFYFPQLVYTAFLILGAFTAFLIDTGRPRFAFAFMAGVILLNAAAQDFRSYDEYAEARWLAKQTETGAHPVATDPLTAVRTRMFLTLSGLNEEQAADRVRFYPEEPRPACALVYVATPLGARPAIAPEPGWVEIESARVRKPRWTHALLRTLGAQSWGSARLAEILAITPPVALYATSEKCARDFRRKVMVSPGGIEPPTT